jgi:sugar phosphate isomerase/epimerase
MDRFKGLKIGIQAWTFRQFELPEIMNFMGELGLKHLELGYLGKSGLSPDDESKTAHATELCKKHDIIVETFNPKFPSEADIDVQRPVFDLAKRLGSRVISGGLGANRLGILDGLAEEYNMKIGMHNHGPGGALSDVETIGSILKPHSSRIGLCIDTGHYLRLPLNPIEIMKALKDRVHAIHLRDMGPDKDPIKGDGGNYVEYIVGEGPLDLKGVLKLLLDWEYQGTICLEYKPNADNPMPDIQTALSHIETALAKL